ncbi:MAG TPA: SGNH/GDSL hydrolase family protein [Isosphaeraceae bacterium]|nr:SGNH/GDSL hydrolase family protein [Isosphaeraceae bacterium]
MSRGPSKHRRLFKTGIIVATALIAAAVVAAVPAGRRRALDVAAKARRSAEAAIGLEPDRAVVAAEWARKRRIGVVQARVNLTNFYNKTTPEIRRLFEVGGLAPGDTLIRWGRADPSFVVSSKVFEADESGRSYRLRPNLRSVWLRQVTPQGAPLMLLEVPDTPEVRAAAGPAGAIVDEGSIQTTNSWGLRGPEPDPEATLRGIVLGDSFMQGMFVGDADTPPLLLEKRLADAWRVPVSVLNTGHIGYSPEQYYYTLKQYADRFRPHFVVVSVCPNDFGDYNDVLAGKGDSWDEAGYWLGEIAQVCRSRAIPCVLVPVPVDAQVVNSRRDLYYPARLTHLFPAGPPLYCDPLNDFIDEHLRLVRDGDRRGQRPSTSPLYNLQIADNHFSPLGAALWARVVARRLTLLVDPPPSAESSQER